MDDLTQNERQVVLAVAKMMEVKTKIEEKAAFQGDMDRAVRTFRFALALLELNGASQRAEAFRGGGPVYFTT